MSYVNPDIEGIPGLVFTSADTGGVRITSDLDWEGVQQVVPEIRQIAGSDAEVEGRLIAWAGPYEIYFTIKPFLEDSTLLAASGVLARDAVKTIIRILRGLAKKDPSRRITVVLDDGRQIVINDKPLSDEDAEDVARFFADHQDKPDDKRGGANTPV
jgi:hypothetical protein